MKLNEKKQVVISRYDVEPNLDRAMEQAYRQIADEWIDEDGYFRVDDAHRFIHSLHVRFVSVETVGSMTGRTHNYTFEYWVG